MKTIQNILRYVVLIGIFLLPFIPLFVSTSLFFPYITGKAFLFRIAVEIIFAAWAMLGIIDSQYRPKPSPIFWSVIALVAVSTLATIFGANPYRSFWSNFERMEGLITYLHLLAYFLVLISILKTEKVWRWFLNLSLAVSLVVGFIALNQWLESNSASGFRADATFGNPIYLAVYALIHFFLALFILVRFSDRWSRLVYGAVALFEVVVIYLTGTRSALLGLVGGIFITTLLIALFERERPQLRRWAVALSTIVILSVGGFWLGKDASLIQSNPVLSRLANISLSDATTRHRLLVWHMGWQGVKERPILGWGPENFNLVFNKYYNPALYGAESWFDRSHNILIDWLVHAGITGLLAYLGLFITAAYCIWRKTIWKLAEKSVVSGLLLAYLIHNLFVFDNLVSYLLFFALLGYIHFSSSAKPMEKKNSLSKSTSSLVGWWALPILLVLVLGIYFINVKPMIAGNRLVQAISFYPEQIPSALVLDSYVREEKELFEQVFAAKTMANSEAREQLSTFTLRLIQNNLVSDQRKREFVALTQEQMLNQIRETPLDTRANLFYGLFLSGIGNLQDGLKYVENAKSLSPKKLQIIFELASINLRLGNKDEALSLAKEAYDLRPTVADSARVYVLALLENNKKTEANKVIADFLASGSSLDESFFQVISSLEK